MNEDCATHNKQSLFNMLQQRHQPPSLMFGRDSKLGRKNRFLVGKKGGFQICHYWRHREVAEELTRNGASYVIGQRLHIWLFPVGPKVEVGAKIRKSVSYCSFCADCYKSYGLASCTHCCYILTLWVRVLFLYMIWPLLFAYSVSQMHIDGDEEFN